MMIFRLLLCVFIILILIICLSSVSVHISYWGGKLKWSVWYLGFQILPLRKRKTKSRKKSRLKKKAKKADHDKPKFRQTAEIKQQPDIQPEKKTDNHQKTPDHFKIDKMLERFTRFVGMMDITGSVMAALPATLNSLRKALTWYAIETDIVIADEDAARCAQKYGLWQTVLQNLLTGNFIHTERKKIRIQYDFVAEESCYQFRCRLKLHIGRTIWTVIIFICKYFLDKHKAESVIINEKL